MRIVLCSRKRSLDLSGMMSVIVDDRHSAYLSLFLKTSVRTGKFSQCLNSTVPFDARKIRYRHSRHRIVNIMQAHNRKRYLFISRLAVKGIAPVAEFIICDIRGIIIRAFVTSVSYDRALKPLGDLTVIIYIRVDDKGSV